MTAPPTRSLAELTAPEAQRLLGERSVLLQPIGAVEQHGPHLPLATDAIMARALTDAVVAERAEELDLWALPALSYSKSDEHAWAPGSIWLSDRTLLSVLDDLGRSLAALPPRRLVFVNGHGGNTPLLAVACRTLRRHHGLLTFVLHPSQPADHGGSAPAEELGMGIHAGLNETSMMLALRPDLVHMEHAARNVPEVLAANDHVRFGGSVSFGWTSDDFGPTGVIGDPTGATVELGQQLFDAAVSNAGAALAEVARFELPVRPGP